MPGANRPLPLSGFLQATADLAEVAAEEGHAGFVGRYGGALWRKSGSGRDDSRKVEGVGGRKDNNFIRVGRIANRSYPGHRFGGGELLALKSGDKSTATDFASGFEPTQGLMQFSLRRQQALSRKNLTENNAPALECESRQFLDPEFLGCCRS